QLTGQVSTCCSRFGRGIASPTMLSRSFDFSYPDLIACSLKLHGSAVITGRRCAADRRSCMVGVHIMLMR
ncbi:MAG: hypothetical protein ACK559_23250, partial [bacterium]